MRQEERMFIERLEMEMVSANVSAARHMREATAHIEDQNLWDCWQEAELRAVAARRHWEEARGTW